MPATIDDPAAIEAEIEDLEARRDRLREKRSEVNGELQDARTALQNADTDEEEDKALERAERLQIRADTLTEAITEVEVDLEALQDRLSDARTARRREETLKALAEKGRAAVEAREEYEAVRGEIIDFIEERAEKLARLHADWRGAAEDFRNALRRENRNVYYRPRSTTEEDEAAVEELVEEMRSRGVDDFKAALAPHYNAGRARRWAGWSHEDGYSNPGGHLGEAIEAVRAVGRDQT